MFESELELDLCDLSLKCYYKIEFYGDTSTKKSQMTNLKKKLQFCLYQDGFVH